MTPLYLITVNGIPFANQIDKRNMEYQLQQLSKWPELIVTVTQVEEEQYDAV